MIAQPEKSLAATLIDAILSLPIGSLDWLAACHARADLSLERSGGVETPMVVGLRRMAQYRCRPTRSEEYLDYVWVAASLPRGLLDFLPHGRLRYVTGDNQVYRVHSSAEAAIDALGRAVALRRLLNSRTLNDRWAAGCRTLADRFDRVDGGEGACSAGLRLIAEWRVLPDWFEGDDTCKGGWAIPGRTRRASTKLGAVEDAGLRKMHPRRFA